MAGWHTECELYLYKDSKGGRIQQQCTAGTVYNSQQWMKPCEPFKLAHSEQETCEKNTFIPTLATVTLAQHGRIPRGPSSFARKVFFITEMHITFIV